MTGVVVVYARCSTESQDLTAQRDRLRKLGVPGELIYIDHGMSTEINHSMNGREWRMSASACATGEASGINASTTKRYRKVASFGMSTPACIAVERRKNQC